MKEHTTIHMHVDLERVHTHDKTWAAEPHKWQEFIFLGHDHPATMGTYWIEIKNGDIHWFPLP